MAFGFDQDHVSAACYDQINIFLVASNEVIPVFSGSFTIFSAMLSIPYQGTGQPFEVIVSRPPRIIQDWWQQSGDKSLGKIVAESLAQLGGSLTQAVLDH
jgi:hypothetical protein